MFGHGQATAERPQENESTKAIDKARRRSRLSESDATLPAWHTLELQHGRSAVETSATSCWPLAAR
jgi:hypothetical protein